MRQIHTPGGRQSHPPRDARPSAAAPGSTDSPWLLQLLRDEPGVRFLAAQFLHLSAPLLSPWVDDRSLTRWVDWLEEDRGALPDESSAGRSHPPAS